jgi:hypothetical protein
MTNCPVPLVAAAFVLGAVGSSATAATPPDGGTVSIEAKTVDGTPDMPLATFVEGASEALAAKGFTILQDSGHAAYVAELTLSRVDSGAGTAKVATSGAAMTPGILGGAVGTGVNIPLGTGKSRVVPLQRTRMELRMHKRGEGAILWQATAVTVRAGGTEAGADARVASDLSQALLRSYPIQPDGVVGVP